MVRATIDGLLLPKGYQRPMARVLAAGARAWQPHKPPSTLDWCQRELHLPSETSVAAGPFDLSTRPFWREPLKLLDDPDCRTITIMGAAQDLGKTVLLIAALISRSVCDPAPAMAVSPDQDSSRELRDKVYATGEVSPAVADRLPPERLRNDRWIDLGSMYCYLAYSGSAQRLRARACKYVFATEVDVWQDDPRLGQSVRRLRSRTKAFAEFKIFYESTPTDDASTIAALYQRGDQRKFYVPCPKCNHWQELRFFLHAKGRFAGKGGVAGMQDSAGNWLSAEQARLEAYYICEQGCRIESESKLEMILAGQWVARGQQVKRDRVVGDPARPPRNASFQISSLYSANQSFGDLAEAYLEYRESNQLRVFWNDWLGLPDRVASKVPSWKTLGTRLAWSHRRGTVPAEAYFLTSQADVQADRTYCNVRAWGDKRTSWLVDWETFGRDEPRGEKPKSNEVASDLARLETDILTPYWPLVGKNPFGVDALPVRVLGVDANYRTFEVHNFVRSARGRFGDRVRAMRGDPKVEPTELFRMSVVERNARTGERYEGGLQLWGVFVNAFREQLLSLFGAAVDQPGAWLLTADVLVWGQDYLRQVTNQGPMTELMPSGKQVVRWVTRDRAVGEHAWDCEVLSLCLAEMVTGGNWDASTWRKPQPEPRPPQQAEPLTPLPRSFDDEHFSAR